LPLWADQGRSKVADEPNSQTHQTAPTPVTQPLPDGKVEVHSALSGHQTGGTDGAHERGDNGERPPRNFLRRLTTNEWLTFFVGFSSLVVSFMTYRNAADTSDIKTAIGNLSELATQTKRQADAMQEQLAAVRSQAEEAKLQTAAIAKQTEAIKASSDATVRSAEANITAANAQEKMAQVTAQTRIPEANLLELTLSGGGDADKDGLVHPGLMWKFNNTSGSSFTVKDVIFGVIPGDSLPAEMPAGTRVDGLSVVIGNNNPTSFGPKETIKLKVPKNDWDEVSRGTVKLFFYAKIEYFDSLKEEHSRCFGRQFVFFRRQQQFHDP
jgi:hypothetical protein